MTKEVALLLGMPGASLVRYDDPGTATVVGAWSEDGTLGSRSRARSTSTATPSSRRSCAAAARSGWTYEDASGTLAEKLHERSATARRWRRPSRVGGRLWGALAAATRSDEPLPEGLEQRLCDFAELVAQALANADAHEQLAASRARIVEAGDAERRRLERNLHDGAQQRLVSVALDLRMVDATLEKDPAAARELLAAARTSSRRASTSCASWRAASIRRSSPIAVSGRRSRRW